MRRIARTTGAPLSAVSPAGSTPVGRSPVRRRLLARILPILIVAAGFVVQVAAPAGATATYTVNSNLDTNDGTCDPVNCTLREAIIAANGDGDASAIDFAILPGGVQTISPTSALPNITAPVTTDGTTQPGFVGTPIVELEGSSAGEFASGLRILAGSSTVRGLVINRFEQNGIALFGGGNRVEGNYIGTNVTGSAPLGNLGDGVLIWEGSSNVVGGTTPAQRNVLSGNINRGVRIDSNAAGNSVQGNYIGTDATGTAPVPNFGGVIVHGTSNTVGGTSAGAGNVISGNQHDGVVLSFTGSVGNTVQGNYIGTDATGESALPNQAGGVDIFGGSSNVVGGTVPGARNVISGNGEDGVDISASATGNLVHGNYIGPTASGEALGNDRYGVFIAGTASSNTVGGTAPGAGNRVGGNAAEGLVILDTRVNNQPSPADNAVLQNSIFDNGGLGVDLSTYDFSTDRFADGPTPNDDGTGDADTGPNGFQNFPVLTSAIVDQGATTVTYSLDSAPNTTFRVEFFSNPQCDPSGFGEGKTFLGSASVTTNGSGTAVQTAALDPTPLGSFIAATATDPSGNTSEFSQCVAAAPPVPDFSINDVSKFEGNYGITEFGFTVTRAGHVADASTVQYATSDGTAKAPTDYAAGSGTLTFSPGETSKTVTVPVNGDNATEPDEAFTVTLSNPSGGGTLSDGEGVGTIRNDDLSHTTSCTITGTGGNDTLIGTAGDDVICGRGGDDHVVGGGGDDVILGGEGDDVLVGGDGNDLLVGGNGYDTLRGGDGNDTLQGGNSDDRLDGEAGSDSLSGDNGKDRLTTTDGVGGNDSANGGTASDTCATDPGDSVTSCP